MQKNKISKEDINFKELFNNNKELIFGDLKNCFKVIVGKKISTIDIDEELIYIWIFYYKNLVKYNPDMGAKVIYSLVTDFDQMIKKDSTFLYNGDTKNLEIKTDFTKVWINKNILDMVYFTFQDLGKARNDIDETKKVINGKFKGIVRINTK